MTPAYVWIATLRVPALKVARTQESPLMQGQMVYKKIVVADVVENEILKFGKNEYFKVIAEKYEVLKKNEKIIVIEHSEIDGEDKKFREYPKVCVNLQTDVR